jgi:hypothetical protein
LLTSQAARRQPGGEEAGPLAGQSHRQVGDRQHHEDGDGTAAGGPVDEALHELGPEQGEDGDGDERAGQARQSEAAGPQLGAQKPAPPEGVFGHEPAPNREVVGGRRR